MEKLYIDRTSVNSCTTVWVKDAETINAGTTIFPQPVSRRDARYEEFREKYDVHFIFSDDIPTVDFYAVPQLDLFAKDSSGGYFATIGQITWFEMDAPICYIDVERNCYEIAPNGAIFMEQLDTWKEHMIPRKDIVLYRNLEEAKKEISFVDFGVFSCGCHEEEIENEVE